MKPNYKTSEFWFTVVTFIFSGLFLLGILTDYDQKEDLISDVSHGVESVFLIGGQLAVLYKYINSRKTEKIEYQKTRQKEEDNLHQELEDYVGVDDNDLVNLNTATTLELLKLPTIGPNIARKIVEYRNANGQFYHPEEIMRIKGIGKSTYKNIEQYLTI